jgi:hypothetical protein
MTGVEGFNDYSIFGQLLSIHGNIGCEGFENFVFIIMLDPENYTKRYQESVEEEQYMKII